MRKSHKWVNILLASSLALGVAGCSTAGEPKEAAKTKTEQPKAVQLLNVSYLRKGHS
ncbi:hypothetical protein DFP93_1193 [Aneurinibacillus soli]|uniref:Uncharacterized protein n=1 Tax=Aneurinibacillus soli TaxID=1500254 RepID=A0A0U5BEV9_9BACL|nr:hypothetical protein [Aneurinibacillus soli]PYE59080.1 hypothetical protein DFP93_1193 [Aneurinibacillus soli]BAU29500.1 hypothetical protein CB4_03700 [Aneurinibacillus soli]